MYMYDFLIKKDALILTITAFTCVITVVLKVARVFLNYMYMYKEEKSYYLWYIIVHIFFVYGFRFVALCIQGKE